MPRDNSGVVTLPTNDSSPAAPRNVIRSSDFNELMGDLSSMMQDSLSRSGKGGMTADLDMDGNDLLNAPNLVETSDIGVTVQAYDADLSAIAALTDPAGKITGAVQVGEIDVSSRAQLQALNTSRVKSALFDQSSWRFSASDSSALVLANSFTTTAVDSGTETCTAAAHGLHSGDVVYSTSSVNGLTAETEYFAIRVDYDHFKVATTFANAQAGTAINLTGTTNFTVKVLSDPRQALYVIPTGLAKDGSQGAWVRQASVLHPFMFQPAANGATDDAPALQSMANLALRLKLPVRDSGFYKYLVNYQIVFRPQVPDGYDGSVSPPSEIGFDIDTRPLDIDLNHSKILAGAAMTSIFLFQANPDIPQPALAPFLSRVTHIDFEGQSNATYGIISDWCLGMEGIGNRIDGVTSGVKINGYGVQAWRHNLIRAANCFDLTEGGADGHYEFNDLYPSQAGFLMGNQGTDKPGQLRIFSNAATNESGGTAYFIKAECSSDTDIVRNVTVLANGVSGFDALVYARGFSTAFNLKFWQVCENNLLDYGAKTSIALIDVTEIDGWVISGNSFNPQFVTTTVDAIKITNGGRCMIANNILDKVGGAAIRGQFLTKSTITGNMMHNVGDTVTNTKVMILSNSSSLNDVHHNIVDQDSGSYAQIGLSEESSSNSNRASENTFNNVTTPYVAIGASSLFGNPKTEKFQGSTPTTIAAGSTVYLGSNGSNATENAVLWMAPRPGIIRKIYAASTGAPGVGQTYTYTARKGNVDQTLTCQTSGATFGSESISNPVTVGEGDVLSIKLVTSAGAGVSYHRYYLDFVGL